MKKFLKEFKEFAIKGDAFNLAVGVIIGAAFQGIVKSLTDDIISPLIGLFAKTDFSAWEWVLKEGADGTNVAIKYGAFITAIINFLIMAFVIFLIVKGVNKLTSLGKKKEVPAPTTKKCPFCCSVIDINATKCPHCTSDFETDEISEKEAEN